MKKLIPKIIDVICFAGGSILILEVLLFIFHKYNYTFLGSYLHYNIYYRYYDNIPKIEPLVGIYFIIGIVLIILGILVRVWRKEKN